ncbi:hypothetical protein [Candidatus Albibeggiatoa sp. nov. NOAA]|uniref:hypothetical protein n=1 Tax=Candidatus Albibeggiatoa sp. nov. NOAA TaxID=3162724 RepID=UPI0032FD140F|nr:hypothetical protein [Thiotrichaceae bacterium]
MLNSILFSAGVIGALFSILATDVNNLSLTSPIVISLIVAIAGLVMLNDWIAFAKSPEQEEKEAVETDSISHMLWEFKQAVEQLPITGNMDSLVADIDKITADYLLPLSHQHEMIHHHYHHQGLDIILNLAQAERLLNRTQSAALDGYPNEVQNSYDDLVQVIKLI